MRAIKNFLMSVFHDPDEDRELQALEVQALRAQSHSIEQEAREALRRAEPTGVLIRDLMLGQYDPSQPPYSHKRGE
jgi:hypothetical protein